MGRRRHSTLAPLFQSKRLYSQGPPPISPDFRCSPKWAAKFWNPKVAALTRLPTKGSGSFDPRWKEDPGYKEWAAFVAKYLTFSELIDGNAVLSFGVAAILFQVLKQCGDDPSRENIMRQAANLKDLELPMLLPGIKVNTSPDNYYPIREIQLARFNGESWELFGDNISG